MQHVSIASVATAAGIAAILCLCGQPAVAGEVGRIEYAGKTWIHPKGSAVAVVDYQGRQALRIASRTCPVLLEGSRFRDGTISCDVATNNYNGFCFRAQSLDKTETVYFRPGQESGREIQYIARGLGDWGSWSWLRTNHPGVYEGAARLTKGGWFHVDATVRGSRLEVRIDGAATPHLVVDPIKHEAATGMVGFYGWNGYFANLTYTPAEDAAVPGAATGAAVSP